LAGGRLQQAAHDRWHRRVLGAPTQRLQSGHVRLVVELRRLQRVQHERGAADLLPLGHQRVAKDGAHPLVLFVQGVRDVRDLVAQVTVDGRTLTLPQPFLVIATQNPVEHHGTYPLPESQLDRFLMRIKMGYPSHETERQILRSRTTDELSGTFEPIADVSDVLAMQETVTRIKVDGSLHDYALEIVNRTRKSDQLTLGVSPRGTLMLQRAAQARAFLEGRDFCLPDDFKQLAVAVFSHRVVASTRHASLQKKSETTEMVLREIVESVRVPL